MLRNWKTWNWRGAFFALAGAAYLTYQEVRDDHDSNPSTVMNSELLYAAWTAALGLLLGTTTTGQTQTIAKKEAEKAVDNQ
jgi:hypothetical protein